MAGSISIHEIVLPDTHEGQEKSVNVGVAVLALFILSNFGNTLPAKPDCPEPINTVVGVVGTAFIAETDRPCQIAVGKVIGLKVGLADKLLVQRANTSKSNTVPGAAGGTVGFRWYAAAYKILLPES